VAAEDGSLVYVAAAGTSEIWVLRAEDLSP